MIKPSKEIWVIQYDYRDYEGIETKLFFTMSNPRQWTYMIVDAQHFKSKEFAESVAFEWGLTDVKIEKYGIIDSNNQ